MTSQSWLIFLSCLIIALPFVSVLVYTAFDEWFNVNDIKKKAIREAFEEDMKNQRQLFNNSKNKLDAVRAEYDTKVNDKIRIEQRNKDLEKENNESEKKVKNLVSRMKTIQILNDNHFLSNIIDSIANTIRNENVSRASAANVVIDFGSLYKSIVNCEESKIPLRDELDYTEQYLKLEQVRYANLNYEIYYESMNVPISDDESSPEIVTFNNTDYTRNIKFANINFNQSIPKMLLLSLCNNSIKHGLKRQLFKNTGNIKIYISQSDDCIKIKVFDDGEGYNADMAAYNKSEKEKYAKDKDNIFSGTFFFESIFEAEYVGLSQKSNMKIQALFQDNQIIGSEVTLQYFYT
jgi:sensor histidine kinase YesM